MAVLLLMRLFYWQVFHRSEVEQAGVVDSLSLSAIGWRGTVYDRNGHPLAMSSPVYDVGASPRLITDSLRAAELLAPLLGIPAPELVAQLGKTDRLWVPLVQDLSTLNGQAVKDLGLAGITLDPRPGRYYPEGPMAATVLGFVNRDQVACYGLEERYDSRLRGSDGNASAGGPQVLFDLPIVQAPRNGADLVLTLDRAVQRSAEKHLQKALSDYGAESGSIIVMDPRTGAVLAMAVAPGFDPNAYGSVPPEAYVNSTISELYEPGSVFKVVTLAAALDAGAIRPDDTYDDRGAIEVGGRVFRNWDRMAHGRSTMTDILARSLNVGAVEVAQRLGTTRFYEAVHRFGFGQATGIDLAGEVAGIVRQPGSPDWWPADLAANSFGQGLAVTPLQMATAVAALANDGVLMRPYVVDRIEEDGTVVWQAAPQPLRRVVSADTAKTITRMLVEALPQETPLGVLPGYAAAGKTGTSQMVVDGQYSDRWVIASFAGYVPADDPRLVILVKLDRPQREAWGSRAAAPVWRSLASEVCAYLGIPPDHVEVAGE
jgi:cell division protein FtsI (penicillin-binding protein 3)